MLLYGKDREDLLPPTPCWVTCLGKRLEAEQLAQHSAVHQSFPQGSIGMGVGFLLKHSSLHLPNQIQTLFKFSLSFASYFLNTKFQKLCFLGFSLPSQDFLNKVGSQLSKKGVFYKKRGVGTLGNYVLAPFSRTFVSK